MKKYLIALVFLVQWSLLAFPAPIQHSRWTTNADSAIISGSTLTNIPQSAVSNLVGAFQATNAVLTSLQSLGTNAFYNTNRNLQAGSVNLTNWSLHATTDYAPQAALNSLSNSLGTASTQPTTAFQATNANLTSWAKHLTNAYYGTNLNLQAGSTVLSNVVTLGTNAWVPFGTSLSKGNYRVYNGTNYVSQPSPAGASVLTYDVSTPTGHSWVSQVDPSLLGSGSSLSSAILYRDGIWRVPTATTNGTNVTIYDPVQFTTNVNAQVAIKSGVSVTNLQANGGTAMSTFTASGGSVANMTNTTLFVGDLELQGDLNANFNSIRGVDTIFAGQGVFTNLTLISDLEGGFNNINNVDTLNSGGVITGSLAVTNGASAGYVLTSDADGNATWAPSGGGGGNYSTNADGSGNFYTSVGLSGSPSDPLTNYVTLGYTELGDRAVFLDNDSDGNQQNFAVSGYTFSQKSISGIIFQRYYTINTDYEVSPALNANFIFIDASASNITVTVDAAEDIIEGGTYTPQIIFKRIDSHPEHTVTYVGAGGATFDGLSSFTLEPLETTTIVADGSNYYVTVYSEGLTHPDSLNFSTNATPPLNTNAIVKWVSVNLDGDTNHYRMPLYK